MDRAFQSGASASPPTPPASPSIGHPTGGNPATGTPPTTPGDYWFHMITEEIRALIVAAGLTPSYTDIGQLLQALPGALASRPEMARSLAVPGYQKLPGGLILQWGRVSAPIDSTTTITLPIAFPSTFAGVLVTPVDNIGNLASSPFSTAKPLSLSTFSLRSYYSASNMSNFWFAIGF